MNKYWHLKKEISITVSDIGDDALEDIAIITNSDNSDGTGVRFNDWDSDELIVITDIEEFIDIEFDNYTDNEYTISIAKDVCTNIQKSIDAGVLVSSIAFIK